MRAVLGVWMDHAVFYLEHMEDIGTGIGRKWKRAIPSG